jgi:hypothetical protein
MLKQFTFKFVVFIFGFLFLSNSGLKGFAANFAPADTSEIDSAKTLPNYYKNVDIKIIYPWNEDEPEVCTNVACQLIKEKDVIVEIRIFHKDCTSNIKVKPGLLKFEIRDHESKSLIAKGP